MSNENQSVVIPVPLFNSLTDYLSGRPYREVNQLIDEIRHSAKIIEVPEEVEEEKTDD